MKIHKEGRGSIGLAVGVYVLLNLLSFYFFYGISPLISWSILLLSTVPFGLVIYFFRIPFRHHAHSDDWVIAPCDGKVVAIEEVECDEYFEGRRIQVSIFMSVLNVHVNRYPIGGKVIYKKYHPGKYLFAWHPKSSTENERYTTVLQHRNGKLILAKQIAGALAKRIVNYSEEGMEVRQNEELGFIKFGSRMDVLLPLGTEVLVKLGDKPKGGVIPIAKW